VIALEVVPDNLAALDELGALVRVDPDAYDFPATYRELEKIYRKRDNAQRLLARVMVTQAAMKERDGDLDAAESLYRAAVGRAPGDFAVLGSLVDLHVAMRRWDQAIQAITEFLGSEPPPSDEDRLAALARQAEIHADHEMNPQLAIAVYRQITQIDPSSQLAYYHLAQEAFLLGRFDDARSAIQRAIDLAAAPGGDLSPETLARYYYYLGRITESAGDARGAAVQYRRAAEYDPGYAAPALALARRAAANGDDRGAESMLINAAHEAMQQGSASLAVPLQRGLALLLLAAGDRPAAIEAYRGILAVEPDESPDRIALAEVYAADDVGKAVRELRKVLERDLRQTTAYGLLASLHSRSGETERAARVLSVMETAGYAGDKDRVAAAQARASVVRAPLRQPITPELRAQWLTPAAAIGPLGELFAAIAEPATSMFPQPPLGENLTPLQASDEPTLGAAASDMARLFGVEPEIYVGERVPGGIVALAFPRRILVLDRDVVAEGDAERRFILGWGFDAICTGHATLLSLRRRQRAEFEAFIRSLLLPPDERATATNEFLRTISRPALEVIDRLSTGPEQDVARWIEAACNGPRRAGLVACDDFAAAARALVRMGGEAPGPGEEQGIACGLAVCGEDLVRYYLSDEYHQLREILTAAAPAMAQ
jgi:tetratricopeptide (TPR) repeat protein